MPQLSTVLERLEESNAKFLIFHDKNHVDRLDKPVQFLESSGTIVSIGADSACSSLFCANE